MLLLAQHPRPTKSSLQSPSTPNSYATPAQYITTMQLSKSEFLEEVDQSFQAPLNTAHLLDVSHRLQYQFQEKLQRSDICMLPSYNDTLPSGAESGEFLAADLGGSTFRLARVALHGRQISSNATIQPPSRILRQWSFAIDERVRNLVGRDFFDWMAGRIRHVLDVEAGETRSTTGRVCSMGLSWSFPVDHMSRRAAGILPMGKRFHAADGLLGHDLGEVLEEACRKQGVDLNVSAVVNDSAASLLAQIYANDSTSMAVILGTGLNAAVQLPATAFSPLKLNPFPTPASSRRGSACSNVLVNTELSMFGKDALTTTPWDEVLNDMHPNPHFQPLEHFTSGRYLGEIVRLVISQAIETVDLFAGEVPIAFGPYELQTSTLAAIESDASSSLYAARCALQEAHPLPSHADYTTSDLSFVRRVITKVSDRAAAYLATSIYALCILKNASMITESPSCSDPTKRSPSKKTSISCLGSVLAKYPNYLARVQNWLDVLSQDNINERVDLVLTEEDEGPLVGAAVACSMGTCYASD